MGGRPFVTDALDAGPAARDKCDVGPRVEQPSDQRKSKAGRAAGDRDAESACRCVSHVASSAHLWRTPLRFAREGEP
jgi:hypothetical protein